MNLRISILALICIFGVVSASSAEYYKYTDENGNVHFTDDFTKVPEKQRPNVEKFAESGRSDTFFGESPKDEGEEASESLKNKGEASPEADKADADKEYERFQEKRNQLVQQQQDIEAEYNALMAEKSALEKQRSPRMLRPQVIELNEKTDALNQKIADYEKRRAAFDAKVTQFNAEIEQSEAADSEKAKTPEKSQ